MEGIKKIYKRALLENRYALACSLAASLAITFVLALMLLGIVAYWPIALLVAISASVASARFRKPYEISDWKIAALLALNFLIFAVFFLLL